MSIVWAIIAIVVILGFVSLQEGNGKAKVKALLEEKGFKEIDIKTKMFTGSQGTVTFEVQYLDKSGAVRNNSCVVHTATFSEEKIFWEKPLE
ncbi:MAG: hypothetical protein U0Z26_04655 [Anaerolineales bacterium]